MSFSTVSLLILVTLLAIYSFALLTLNNSIINIDLLFVEIDFKLGNLILLSFCLGIAITVLLELIYFSSKKKHKDE